MLKKNYKMLMKETEDHKNPGFLFERSNIVKMTILHRQSTD